MRGARVLLPVLLLLLGMGILCYPGVSSFVNGLHGSYAIAQFQTRVENEDIALEKEKAAAYNEWVRRCGKAQTPSADMPEYEKILDFGGGMMGYLEIPCIQLKMPIYHGTGEQTLARGIGHMEQTALPVGGKGNHTVLTGHTGLPSARIFDDLTQLEIGDLFQIHILSDTLRYRVDQIRVVLPSEGEDLAAEEDRDYCTLVTCTPYGINTHRLLVRGSRVTQTEAQPGPQGKTGQSYGFAAVILAAGMLLAMALTVTVVLDVRSYGEAENY